MFWPPRWRWASLVFAVASLGSQMLWAQSLTLRNAAGLVVSVDALHADPELRVVVPGGGAAERTFDILMPEHVTVRAHGQTDATHLYVFDPAFRGAAPQWTKQGSSLEYTEELGPWQFTARATLSEDGLLFRYTFQNRSSTQYDYVTAITDPRFSKVFYDPRLERTYVHTSRGFVLLGSEAPERLTEPLSSWLPVRVHASFTAPIPAERVQRRADGITYRYLSQRVDLPMVATVSSDGRWVAASFAKRPGNVWSNPELTCQHVDPDVEVGPGGRASYEVKLLIFRGSLTDVLTKVRSQRRHLQP